MKLLLRFLLSAALTIVAAPGVAQAPAGAAKESEKEATPAELDRKAFRSLRDERARLLGEIDDLDKQELPKLSFQRERADNVVRSIKESESSLERAKRELKEAQDGKASANVLDQIRRRMSDVERRLSYDRDEQQRFPDPKEAREKFDKALEELNSKRKRLAAVETAIDGKLSVETVHQDFKTKMSGAFAVLVGLVIFGFFAISWRDGEVRRAVFSGQAGIQLLTLFSLVIAIILFGITGVLEGKELSALLGGLSGYILGRVTQPPAGGNNVPSAPAAAPVPAPGSVG